MRNLEDAIPAAVKKFGFNGLKSWKEGRQTSFSIFHAATLPPRDIRLVDVDNPLRLTFNTLP